MKSALRIVLPLTLLLILFTFVVDAREVWAILRGIDALHLLAAAAVVTADRALMAYKWLLLLRSRGYTQWSLARGTAVYCASMLWGAALPTTVGADAIRAVLAMRGGIRGADVAASIVVERIIGFIAALVLAVASFVMLSAGDVMVGSYGAAFSMGAGLLLAACGLLALGLNPVVFDVLVVRLPARLRQSALLTRLRALVLAYRSMSTDRGTIRRFTALTALEQFFGIALAWVLARGLGAELELGLLLATVPLATLIARIPISIDGLGVYEAALAGLMGLLGVPAALAVAIALAGRAVQILCVLPWWLVQVLRFGSPHPPATRVRPGRSRRQRPGAIAVGIVRGCSAGAFRSARRNGR